MIGWVSACDHLNRSAKNIRIRCIRCVCASLRRYRSFVAKSVSLSRRLRRKSIKQKFCICPHSIHWHACEPTEEPHAVLRVVAASVSACSAPRRCRTDSTIHCDKYRSIAPLHILAHWRPYEIEDIRTIYKHIHCRHTPAHSVHERYCDDDDDSRTIRSFARHTHKHHCELILIWKQL